MNKENASSTILYYAFKDSMEMMIVDKNSINQKTKIFRKAVPVILKADINSILPYEDEINRSDNGVVVDYIVYDINNKKCKLRNFINKDDLYSLKRCPLILTLIVSKSFYGELSHNAPVGFLTFKEYRNYTLDSLPSKPSKYILSDNYCENEGFKKLSHENELSNDRVIVKLDDSVSDYVRETLFGPCDTDKEWLNHRLKEHLRHIVAYDYDSDYSVDIDELSENLNNIQITERDYIANLKKVKLGLIKDNKIINIKKTNVILNKNKNLYYGYDADKVRFLEYMELYNTFKYQADELVLMESFWVRTKIPGHTYLIDSNGNKQKTVFMKIDPRTHQLVDNILYLRNGDIVDNKIIEGVFYDKA